MLEESKEKIEKLKEYFAKRDDVVMAFLFGSQAEGSARQDSDWDVAVYFTPTVERVEWEEQNREYPEEDRVWGDCMDILKTDTVDCIVLNRAPASMCDAAIRGIPLVIKDRGLYLNFLLITTRQAEDFREFVKDYYEIYQRSQSLTAQDQERLRNLIVFIEEQMALYGYYSQFQLADYTENIHKRGEVERWVENIVNVSIDISKIILSSEKKMIPPAYRETMSRAVTVLKLPEEFIEKFERWVKLRNVLAHEYLDIKWKRIEDFIHHSESYFKSFVDAAKKFLNE